jgi:hypothetical protein
MATGEALRDGFLPSRERNKTLPSRFAFAGTVVLGGRQVGVRCQIMREGISQRTRLPEDSSRKGGDAHPLMRKSVATTW